MSTPSRFLAILVLAAATTTGCAATGAATPTEAPRVAERIEHGVVEDVRLFRVEKENPVSAGTVIGAIAGGVIGHQVGGGRGKDLATVAGAAAGAYAGRSVERAEEVYRYRISIRLEGGAVAELEESEAKFNVGDRVRLVNGRAYRE